MSSVQVETGKQVLRKREQMSLTGSGLAQGLSREFCDSKLPPWSILFIFMQEAGG